MPSWRGGFALLLLAEATRIYGVLSLRFSAERYALVLAVAALVLMVAGWQVFRSVVWNLLFLFLMVPLPGSLHNLISGPLQHMATTGSVFLLEAFGATVSQEGNIVMLNETTPMAVAEACSGLRMLTAFVIVAGFVACMVKRPGPQKAVLFLSSIPIAVMCNVVRLCITAVFILLVGSEAGQKFFHDFAGLAMMPVAALLLFAELWLMDKLIVPEPGSQQEKTGKYPKSDAKNNAK
jgi:exosortase